MIEPASTHRLPSLSPGEETPLLAGHMRDSTLSLPTAPNHPSTQAKNHSGTEPTKPRPGAFPRPVGGTSKLGTFAGVFVPTTLNVLSILMFLRFGFIIGQAGVVGMMGE
jgi:potassium/chloride transporter 9